MPEAVPATATAGADQLQPRPTDAAGLTGDASTVSLPDVHPGHRL